MHNVWGREDKGLGLLVTRLGDFEGTEICLLELGPHPESGNEEEMIDQESRELQQDCVLAAWLQTQLIDNRKLAVWEVQATVEVTPARTTWLITVKHFPRYTIKAVALSGPCKLENVAGFSLFLEIGCKGSLCSRIIYQGRWLNHSEALQWGFKMRTMYKTDDLTKRPINQFQQKQLYGVQSPDSGELQELENSLLAVVVRLMPYQHANNVCRLKGKLYRIGDRGLEQLSIQTQEGLWTWRSVFQGGRCMPSGSDNKSYQVELDVGCYRNECMMDRSDQNWMTEEQAYQYWPYSLVRPVRRIERTENCGLVFRGGRLRKRETGGNILVAYIPIPSEIFTPSDVQRTLTVRDDEKWNRLCVMAMHVTFGNGTRGGSECTMRISGSRGCGVWRFILHRICHLMRSTHWR